MKVFKLSLDDIFQENKELIRPFLCIKCKFLKLNNFCLECGHNICKTCIKTLKNCPKHKEVILNKDCDYTSNFLDNFLINKVKCYCHHKKEGCNFTGNIKQLLNNHICPYENKIIIDENYNEKKEKKKLLGIKKKSEKELEEIIELNDLNDINDNEIIYINNNKEEIIDLNHRNIKKKNANNNLKNVINLINDEDIIELN